MPNDEQLDALRSEMDRLRAENDQLRSRFRVAPSNSPGPIESRRRRPVRVLLLPDPLAAGEPGRLGPDGIAGVAQVLVPMLQERQPDFEWRAEHDLARVPEDADCYQVGQVVRRMWDGEGPAPTAFRVVRDDEGESRMRRCLLADDPESDRFSGGYDRQLRVVDDLLAEGKAAHEAGAHHHAGWTLKAVDVVMAQLNLALVDFQAGGERWRGELAKPRPEYDPRYSVERGMPIGM